MTKILLNYKYIHTDIYFDTPKGIRIPVTSVKGKCPRPLDDGGFVFIIYYMKE